MAKRALCVGITDYLRPTSVLEAAAPEAQNWADLLHSTFGFSITPLFNNNATHTNVRSALETLLSNAAAGDQLVFVYSGHGDRVPTPSDPSQQDEALILFHPLDADPAATALTDSELSDMLRQHPLDGVLFTLVLECCFAGGFEPSAIKKFLHKVLAKLGFQPAKVLSPARAAGSNDDARREVHQFGLLWDQAVQARRPLVVAACASGRLAAQLPIIPLQQPHMLFSGKAVPKLMLNPKFTHEGLLQAINPLDHPSNALVEPQFAVLAGDSTRNGHKFFT